MEKTSFEFSCADSESKHSILSKRFLSITMKKFLGGI